MRKIEKRVLLAAATWNIIAALLTIVGYSGWFREKGTAIFEANQQTSYLSSSLLDSVVKVAMLYGLLILAVGIMSIYMRHAIEKPVVDRKVIGWLGFCTVLSFLSFDVIGIVLYLSTLVVYVARNKALKKQHTVVN